MSCYFFGKDNNIKSNFVVWNSKEESREEYDAKLVSLVKSVAEQKPDDLIVLADDAYFYRNFY